jgi:bisphosphoglycerate-dependent phosphoglycerate mutase
MPGGESMEELTSKVRPYFTEVIFSGIEAGENTLLVVHGNVIRSIAKVLDEEYGGTIDVDKISAN